MALVFLLAAASCCLTCAKEGMPPGGPEDTTPPEVVSASPPPGSTQVPLDSRLEIVFSEAMSPKITEQSIFISPLPKEPFEFRWKGKKLTLSPQVPLYPDKTYVISVGADAQDLRRNRLGQTYSFAFSTGGQLDFGSISGQVWIKHEIGLGPEAGASVWAYLLSQDRSEVDPETDKPDYITQTADQGSFQLENLSLGRYRIFAVQDLDRDLSWDWETESIGVAANDVEVTGPDIGADNVNLILHRKDRKSPHLSGCHSLNQSLIKLEFDEELDQPSALDTANYRLRPSVTGELMEISSAFFEGGDASKVVLLAHPTNPQVEYHVSVRNVKDRAGNPLDTLANSCRFKGSEIPDTTGPVVTKIDPEEGEVNVLPDAAVTLTFSEPPEKQRVEQSFSLLDSTDERIPGKGQWIGPNVYVFSADSPLAGNMELRVNLRLEEVHDQLGNLSRGDSVFTSRFVTVNPDTLGSVSGSLDIQGKIDITPIGLTLWHLQQKDLVYRLTLAEPGPFEFGAVLPGKYFLAAWLDLDQDGVLSPGEPNPFLAGEPFEVYPDTVHVRSRWESQGIELVFRER